MCNKYFCHFEWYFHIEVILFLFLVTGGEKLSVNNQYCYLSFGHLVERVFWFNATDCFGLKFFEILIYYFCLEIDFPLI